MRWYIAKCPSGAEHNAIKTLRELLQKAHLEDEFGEYFIPYEKPANRFSKRSNMANYIFIRMNLTEKVSTLLNKVETMNLMLDENLAPIVQEDEAVAKMLDKINENKSAENNILQVGESVQLLQEGFTDFVARIEKIDYDKQIASVSVPIWGRQIEMELPFNLIKRIKE